MKQKDDKDPNLFVCQLYISRYTVEKQMGLYEFLQD